MKKYAYISNILRLSNLKLRINRHLGLIFILNALACLSFSQNDTVNNQGNDSEILETTENINSKPEIAKMAATTDTTNFMFGDKHFSFISKEEGGIVVLVDDETGKTKRFVISNDSVMEPGSGSSEEMKDKDACTSDNWDLFWSNIENGEGFMRDSTKFRGHWSGIEFGPNYFVESDFVLKRPTAPDFMDLNLKIVSSWNINFNFAQSSTPIIKDRFGVIGGLGLEINNYRFKNNNNIQSNPSTDIIEERDLSAYNVRRSKFTTTYLTTPILLEAQFGKGNSKDRFYISGGAIVGLKLSSAIKVIHEVDGKKQKLIERRGDLNINRWRVGATARIGYQDYFSLYANYYITPLFAKGTGPELHPFSLGARIDF